MVIHSYGFAPAHLDADAVAQECLLFNSIGLILDHSQSIINCPKYFFCSLPFAFCSWPYVSGDGPLVLGYLILGWQSGHLIAPCANCNGDVHLISFGGSPLSGSNVWHGFCVSCQQAMRGSSAGSTFRQRMDFVCEVRKRFPTHASVWEEYDGDVFSWGGSGLSPRRKNRLVIRQLTEPVSFEVLIEDLRSGNVQNPTRP